MNNIKHIRNKRAQNFSIDLIISIVIFLGVITVLFFIFNQSLNNPDKQLKLDANTLANKLTKTSHVGGGNNDLSILNSDNLQIDYAKLLKLAAESISDYGKLKQELSIENDFCIILENKLNGTIYPIMFRNDRTVTLKNGSQFTIPKYSVMYGIGSPKVKINGTHYSCGYLYNISNTGNLTQIYPPK
ncbi:MAG: hypothetical protein GWP09_02000 [Nitrospiraceae bacterium]|nr:hypothetical protein [Nitrospiraceae bacterium]